MLLDMSFSLNINIAKLLSINYWLDPIPPSGKLLFLIISILLTLILFGSGLIVWQLNRKYFKEVPPKKKVLDWVSTTLFSFVPAAILLLLLRLEGIGYVSIRILWPVLFLIVLGINAYYLYYFFKIVPKQLNKIETIKLKQKYFRRKKKN